MRPSSSYALTALSAMVICLLFGGCADSSTENSGTGGDTAKDSQPKPNPLSVVFQTDEGEFEVLLRPDIAPKSTANFCNLVDRGFYHGLEFVGANAVARGLGQTPRTPDYQLDPEYSMELLFDNAGVVSWSSLPRANEDDPFIPHPTRFFISMKPQPEWNLSYVPFGTLKSGADVLGKVEVGDWIRSARVTGDPTWLMEMYKTDIAMWNEKLDAIGLTRAGTPRQTPNLSTSSN